MDTSHDDSAQGHHSHNHDGPGEHGQAGDNGSPIGRLIGAHRCAAPAAARVHEYNGKYAFKFPQVRTHAAFTRDYSLASAEEHLAPERELELSERLLTLYISVSDGVLIF
jgi:hypothetical protein